MILYGMLLLDLKTTHCYLYIFCFSYGYHYKIVKYLHKGKYCRDVSALSIREYSIIHKQNAPENITKIINIVKQSLFIFDIVVLTCNVIFIHCYLFRWGFTNELKPGTQGVSSHFTPYFSQTMSYLIISRGITSYF